MVLDLKKNNVIIPIERLSKNNIINSKKISSKYIKKEVLYLENISFDLYRLFYCVANCNTISKAAELLYISQPAVTQGIKKLEDQIEGKLFYRTNKGIELTEEGKRLYQYIEKSIQIELIKFS